MNNFTDNHNKIVIRLKSLYEKHKTLDNEVNELYNKFESNEIVNRKKTQKLWLKDEIYRLENKLKALE